jgi:hypothetical protein
MSTSASTTANRRLSRRQQPKRTTKVACRVGVMGTGPNLALGILDVSETGLRLLAKSPLNIGQQVEISLEGLWQRQPLRLPAEVVWCLATSDGKQCAGIKFHKRLSYADFQSLAYV